MICFILLITTYVCQAFGVQFAQDVFSLGLAAFLEMLAEVLIVTFIATIKAIKGDGK